MVSAKYYPNLKPFFNAFQSFFWDSTFYKPRIKIQTCLKSIWTLYKNVVFLFHVLAGIEMPASSAASPEKNNLATPSCWPVLVRH